MCLTWLGSKLADGSAEAMACAALWQVRGARGAGRYGGSSLEELAAGKWGGQG